MEKVNSRKDFLSKDYQLKMSIEMKNLITLKRALLEKEQESKHLESVITQLTVEVQQSENIKQSKLQASGGEGVANAVANQKMKKVVQRKKLVDLARVQAEEIEVLRQELDRMRQRTFPSFVK
ncbi:hypothetical protein EON64_00050 [archaeon]|nr:MAG: hypothetical protein EON64_00050 [archaeon]